MTPPDHEVTTDETAGDAMPRRRAHRNGLIVATGAALALTLAGVGIANAQTGTSQPAESTTAGGGSQESALVAADEAACADGHGRRRAHNENQLTGDTADKAKAAALEAVPGATVLRASASDKDASAETAYHVHLRNPDGTHVVVHEDKDFEVLSVTEKAPRSVGGRGRGHHAPHPGDRDRPSTPTTSTSA